LAITSLHPLQLLAASEPSPVLGDLLVILVCASVVTVLGQYLRVAVIPAFLLTGALIGPTGLSLVPGADELGFISHLAIVLLMFGIGLELDLSTLKKGWARLILVGGGSCVLTTAAGWPLACAAGLSAPAGLAVAMALSLSSTAVVLRIFAEQRRLREPAGQLSFAVLIVQDLLVIAMLASLPLLAGWAGLTTLEAAADEGAASPSGMMRVAMMVGRLLGVVLLVGFAWLTLPHIFRAAARAQSTQVLLVVGVAAAMAAATATYRLGFSLEMGAFLAGFVLAGTVFKDQLHAQIGPLRDLFIAVFFTVLGMKLDLGAAWAGGWFVVIGLVSLVVLKTAGISLAAWLGGSGSGVAAAVGLTLAHGGEFSLVVMDAAFAGGLLDNEQLSRLVAVVVLSLLVTPMLISLGRKTAPRLGHWPTVPWGSRKDQAESHAADGAAADRHVVLAGFGPTGRLVARELEHRRIPYVVVEINAETVRRERARGTQVVFGDVSQEAVLEAARIHDACALVLTIPDEAAARRGAALARRHCAHLFIVTRVPHLASELGVRKAGADQVVVDEAAAADAMVRAVMIGLSGEASGLHLDTASTESTATQGAVLVESREDESATGGEDAAAGGSTPTQGPSTRLR
jgi:CPA2 family monovalent cation:H+ antiporter-2